MSRITRRGGIASHAPLTVPPVDPTAPTASGRWFLPGSQWNTPISSNPTISPDSAAQVSYAASNAAGAFYPTNSSVPSVYVVDSSVPTVGVVRNFPTCGAAEFQVRIPAGAIAGHGDYVFDVESPMVIQYADTGEEWDLYRATPPGYSPTKLSSGGPSSPCPTSATKWACTVITNNNPGWNGTGIGNTYAASGCIGGTGLIRPRDFLTTTGTMDHAISMSYVLTRNTFVAPATRSDGPNPASVTASVPMGSRWQLNPSFNVDTDPLSSGLPAWLRKMLRTMQVYGCIVTDSGSAIHNEGYGSVHQRGELWPWEISGQNPGTIPSGVVSQFRVLYAP